MTFLFLSLSLSLLIINNVSHHDISPPLLSLSPSLPSPRATGKAASNNPSPPAPALPVRRKTKRCISAAATPSSPSIAPFSRTTTVTAAKERAGIARSSTSAPASAPRIILGEKLKRERAKREKRGQGGKVIGCSFLRSVIPCHALAFSLRPGGASRDSHVAAAACGDSVPRLLSGDSATSQLRALPGRAPAGRTALPRPTPHHKPPTPLQDSGNVVADMATTFLLSLRS